MRCLISIRLHLLLLSGVFSAVIAAPTRADVLISVDKSTQQMSVSVDGTARYSWPISTGRDHYGTPNGYYRPQRLARTWFSKKYYNSPMPHSIFFHGGYAIHGSYEISRLGGPASHGCIRLHPQNAATLFALVKEEGVTETKIVVSGYTPVVARSHARSPYLARSYRGNQRGFARAYRSPPFFLFSSF
jgi:lipoprotein-anchoring transpeptidase ErfK/SrfK